MTMSPNLAVLTNQGPIRGPVTKTGTAPLAITTGGGAILNATVGTSATRVLLAHTSPRGSVRRCKLVCLTAGANLSYEPVPNGTAAPTMTAVGDGASANDGSLVGSGVTERFSVLDNQDLYLAASAAATAFQLHVDEAP